MKKVCKWWHSRKELKTLKITEMQGEKLERNCEKISLIGAKLEISYQLLNETTIFLKFSLWHQLQTPSKTP